MPYYSWFHGHGRAVLADDLGADDPFGLAPGAIVDRIVAAGYTPAVEHSQDVLFPTLGVASEVEREGVKYLVSISRDEEQIGVQEWRAEVYDPVE